MRGGPSPSPVRVVLTRSVARVFVGGVVVAELVFSTSSFCALGLTTPDVPILLDAQMRLIEPAFGGLYEALA